MVKTYSEEARGFIAGYVQVFLDELIDGNQLIEGLSYWYLDLDEIKRSGLLDDFDSETRQKVLDVFKEVA